ncbi:MAG: hypothetical protein ACXVGB_10545 [Mycobacteriaceae bacterium]
MRHPPGVAGIGAGAADATVAGALGCALGCGTGSAVVAVGRAGEGATGGRAGADEGLPHAAKVSVSATVAAAESRRNRSNPVSAR